MLSLQVFLLSRRRLQAIHLAVACGMGLVFGVACLWFSPLWVLGGLASMCFLVVMLKRPEVGLLAILVMTSSIVFEDKLPLVPIGVGSLNLPDIPLLMLLALIIVRRLIEPDFNLVRTPLDLPLLTFYGMVLLSTILAVARSSVSTTEALRGIRGMTYYLTFFIVTNLVRRKDQFLLLIEGIILLATIVAGAMVVQSLAGKAINLFPGRVETLVTQGSTYAGVTRVLPPGQSLVMFGFILLIVLIAADNTPSLLIVRYFQAGLVGLAVILTFNRNFWVIAGLAVALLVWLLHGRDRQKLLGRGLLALLLGAVALGLAFTRSEQVDRLIQATLARAGTLTRSDTAEEGSLQFRYIENSYALPQIASHPIVGLGLRVPYRPALKTLDGVGRTRIDLFYRTTYIHNAHLSVLLTSGWIGYLALIWLSTAFLLRSFKNWRHVPDVKLKAILLACVLIYVGTCVAANISPLYMDRIWIPILGIILGTGEAILSFGKLPKSVLR